MQLIRVDNPTTWDHVLLKIPYAHVLQSWAWGEHKAEFGWLPFRLLFVEGQEIVAAAQALRRPLPRTPFGVLYVPKGPAVAFDEPARVEAVLGALEAFARAQNAIFIKADPDIRADAPAARLLPARGWRVSPEQIQFHNTVTLNLARSEDEILAGMKPKWRYNIRLAERKGVAVSAGTEAELRLWYDLYAETSTRDGFIIRGFDYYAALWTRMLRAGQAQVWLARHASQAIAGIIVFTFGKRAWYFYGASRDSQRELMPNHLLQWEAIRRARAQGITEYDFWGAPDELAETAPMYGVYKFKMGFGGEFVERIPAHDFVINPALYWAYAVARPRYLKRLRGKQAAVVGE